jgi:hypothetical protein
MFLGSKVRRVRKADNLTPICEPVGDSPHIMIIVFILVNHFIYTMYNIYTIYTH